MDAPAMLNDRSSALALLLSRRSGKARDLGPPGPTLEELATILKAAIRVPDHGKLAPWRFVVVERRAALAERIESLYLADKGGEAGRLERQALRDFVHQAPTLVVALSLPKPSAIPEWEQQLSMGAAIAHLLLAAHALGYVGNWLTGPAAYLPGVAEELGVPGGRIAGFLFLGRATRPLEERPRPSPDDVILHY
ncbi:MAG: nitroreductase family protein [Sphingomonadaceae bacterium]|uniref:nitroreductase family protein n=1 Tax=Thermaurantiacus sp. TaxID=2820283 RepID=UPI00298F26D8|nr:nitroreductase family protein [Thermaurantiacus sp.]MCS6986771.1 nitroreductase family protein [Sphingomonadaceae bacterium]MDW8413966.1 nitroreductase family protein [Thermaurantiacus sp.]